MGKREAIAALKETSMKNFCPFGISEVDELFTTKQVDYFCKDGCSVDCPKFMLERLERMKDDKRI